MKISTIEAKLEALEKKWTEIRKMEDDRMRDPNHPMFNETDLDVVSAFVDPEIEELFDAYWAERDRLSNLLLHLRVKQWEEEGDCRIDLDVLLCSSRIDAPWD